MKRIRVFLLTIAILALLCPISGAMPLYITIDGTQHDDGLSEMGYHNDIKLIIMIDRDRQGTYQTPDNVTHEYEDFTSPRESGMELTDYFFAELVSYSFSHGVHEWEGFDVGGVGDTAKNYAVDNLEIASEPWAHSFLQITVPDVMGIYMNCDVDKYLWENAFPGSWTGWAGITLFDPTDGIFKEIPSYDLYISSTSDRNPTIPTPEPVTIILLGTGILGLSGVLRRAH